MKTILLVLFLNAALVGGESFGQKTAKPKAETKYLSARLQVLNKIIGLKFDEHYDRYIATDYSPKLGWSVEDKFLKAFSETHSNERFHKGQDCKELKAADSDFMHVVSKDDLKSKGVVFFALVKSQSNDKLEIVGGFYGGSLFASYASYVFIKIDGKWVFQKKKSQIHS